MSEGNLNQKNFVSGLSSIGLGFPTSNKTGVSIGVFPYSSVGYNINTDREISSIGSTVEEIANYHYVGSGGINQLVFGTSWKITNSISIGSNLHYLFGNISREKTIMTNEDSPYFLEQTHQIINGFNFKIGLLYQQDINSFLDDGKINLGLTLTPRKNIQSIINQTNSIYSGPNYNIDDAEIVSNHDNINNTIILPSSSSLGLSLEFMDKAMLGLEYIHTQWVKDDNEYIANHMTPQNRLILGGYITPKKTDIYNYFNRVQYRFGISVASGYLNLSSLYDSTTEDSELQDISFSFGMGLPINQMSSMMDISLCYGFTKPSEDLEINSILGNYFKIHISMTFNEKWFNKRKIQ